MLTRKLGPAGNDGLPSAIECGNQGANGVRRKYARVYIIVEEVAHFTPSPLWEVGQQFSVTRERIRQIEAKALRKLKHPSRSRILRSFLDN